MAVDAVCYRASFFIERLGGRQATLHAVDEAPSSLCSFVVQRQMRQTHRITWSETRPPSVSTYRRAGQGGSRETKGELSYG